MAQNTSKIKTFIDKWDKQQKIAVSIITGLIILIATIKPVAISISETRKAIKSIPLIEERLTALEIQHEQDMQNLIDTLRIELTNIGDAVNVLTGIVSSNMWRADTLEYEVEWHGKKSEAILRLTRLDDLFVFIPADRVGQRPFSIKWSFDRQRYKFIDFDGHEIDLIPKK